MFQTKVVEKIKTLILCSVTFYFKSCRFSDMWKNIVSQAGHTSVCALHPRYLKRQIHPQNM